MKTDRYLGMRPGDLEGKPYAAYWNPEMRPLQPHVAAAVLHGSEAGQLGFPMHEADQLVEPGYLPLENGFTKLRDGKIFVASNATFPAANAPRRPRFTSRTWATRPEAHAASTCASATRRRTVRGARGTMA